MKIRCEQNSIRLRLRRSELVQLRAEKWLETGIHFPDTQVLAWELLLDEVVQEMSLNLEPNRLTIRIPSDVAYSWMDSDQVGIERFFPLNTGGALHVLVEKDFPCKDRPGEDKSDFFTELSEEAPVKC